MRACVLLAAAASLAFAPVPYLKTPKAGGEGLPALQGLWLCLTLERSGGAVRPYPGKMHARFAGDTVTFVTDPASTVGTKYKAVVDPKARPATLDLVRPGEAPPAYQVVGIHKIEGDTLYFTYTSGPVRDGMAARRPEGFKPSAPLHILMTLKRVIDPLKGGAMTAAPLAVLAAVAFAPLPFAKLGRPAEGLAGLRGLWVAVSLETTSGARAYGPSYVRFEGGAASYAVTPDAKAGTVYTAVADAKAKPATLDLMHPGSSPPTFQVVGIYRIEGDTLYFIYTTRGGQDQGRPAGFKPTAVNHILMTYKRVAVPPKGDKK